MFPYRSIGLVTLLALAVSPLHAKKSRSPARQEKQRQEKQEPKQEPLPAEEQLLLQDTLPDAPKRVLACAGAFAPDSSHAKLIAEFGAKNVTYRDVEEAGRKDKASVLFDDDPTRRAVVFWRDAAAKANPLAIAVGAPSTWTGPGGIHNGLPLKEVEKLGGGAFKLTGFDGKNSGLAARFKGALAAPAGGCTLTVRFEPGIANPLPKKFAAITGDKEVPSSHPLMRRARPQVSEWTLSYP